MRKNNKRCLICSNLYTFCLNCGEFDHLPRWMNMFDKKECKEIFDAVSDYKSNLCTKEETEERLIKVGALNMKLNKTVKKTVDEIMEESNKSNLDYDENLEEISCKKRKSKKNISNI